jgi:hypothetical protein
MRAPRALLAASLLVTTLLGALAACGDDGGGGRSLSTSEQTYADALAKDLQSSKDGGFAVSEDDADCMATAVLATIGAKPFTDAGVKPKDLAGDESPGELLGKGAISDAEARSIASAWGDCTDLATAFASAARDDFDLDDDGVTCFADGLRKSDTLDSFVVQSFTAAEDDPQGEVLAELVTLVNTCSAGEGGTGGLLVDSIAKSLEEGSGLTAEEATCVAQHAVDSVGPERLIELTAQGDGPEAEQAAQDELAAAVVEAAKACHVPVPLENVTP